MTVLATETTATANGVANTPEASQVFHVEHRCGRTGHRVELARYTVGGGEERILFGQRVDGVVRLTDCPMEGGRSYLVERELEQDGHGANAALHALIADYLQESRRLNDVPMRASTLRHYLDQLAD